MKSKDLLLKALDFTAANFDVEVAAMFLDNEEPTDEEVDEANAQLSRLYREIDEGVLTLVATKPRSERQ